MKVTLVAVNSKFIHSNLAVRYLKAYTKDMPYECNIKEFSINDRIERIVQEIMLDKPDAIALSCYIWNIEYILKISRLIKLIDSNISIILGGPEVSYDGKVYIDGNKYCDYIIEGEGEEIYRELIESFLNPSVNKREIKGLYFIEQGEVVYTGKRELMDMNKIAFPYEQSENLDNKIVYYEASRGCPFNCKYCLSSTIHGVRFLDIERVKKELKFFIDKKVRLVKFVDRTFNCNHKFAYDIWQFLINQDTETTFHFEISADLLSKEEIELLYSAPKDRFQFEVGVQTTNDEVLSNINRNANFQDIREKVEELLRIRNIKQHVDLIAGLPGEDLNSFKKSFNDLYTVEAEEIQLGFLKLLKGSDMRKESEKWGMVYSPYPPYEILKTKHISYDEIVELKRVDAVLDKYYNSNKFNNILKYFIDIYDKPFNFYHDLGEFCYKKGYFDRNISNADYYKVFLEFNEEVLEKDNGILSEIVKYDYLIFNKKKWLPGFLTRHLDKKEEKEIRNNLIEKGFIEKSELSNNAHIEKFSIDILKFKEEGKIYNNNSILLFLEDKKSTVKDITMLENCAK